MKTNAVLKIQVFWDVTLHRLVLMFQSWYLNPKHQAVQNQSTGEKCEDILGLFDSKDKDTTLLRNVGNYLPSNTT
jgi:hypothetical protein